MKIGILTFHRAHNYGAVLQCYALQETLKKMGHHVEVIDYRQKWTEEMYKPFSIMYMTVRCQSIKSRGRYIIGFPKRYNRYRRKNNSFSSFRSRFLSISPKYNTDITLKYDACIVGSDQLWNMACLGGEFDDVFLGNFNIKDGAKKIGYAIGSNLMSVDNLNQNHRLIQSLRNFSYISFRESVTTNRINDLTGIQYPQCLDPTLLTNKDVWSSLLNDKWKKRKYIVCYQVRYNGDTTFSLIQAARILAQKKGWEVVNLSTGENNVEDFVSAIAYAQYIVTTSFHATVFSLIFNKQLAAYLLHDGQDSRYEELLRNINCSQFIYEITDEPRVYQDIDWNKIEERLNRFRESSLTYLSQSL